jgi:hypothetical protein
VPIPVGLWMIPGSETLFGARISPEIVPLSPLPTPPSGPLSPYDHVRFRLWARTALVNLPSIKGPARPHYTIIRLKSQFVQLLTDPKRIDQFTVISVLLSTPNICMILSDIPLLLWHLIALVILRVHGRTT